MSYLIQEQWLIGHPGFVDWENLNFFQKRLNNASDLVNNPSVTALNLSGIREMHGDEPGLSEALRQNTTVTWLNFSKNPLGSLGIQLFASALESNKTLRHLDLSETDNHSKHGIDAEAGKALDQALRRNSSLESLCLHGTRCRDALEQLIPTYTLGTLTLTVEALDLGFTEISSLAVERLGFALHENTSLRSLNLEGNRLGDHQAGCLAWALPLNTTLQKLCLANNKIADIGAKRIAQRLQGSCLISLDLSHTAIGDMGVQALASSLEENRTLLSLRLQNNPITDVSTPYLVSLLEKNQTLQCLDLQFTEMETFVNSQLRARQRARQTLVKICQQAIPRWLIPPPPPPPSNETRCLIA